MPTSKYILENLNEFERLERQSQNEAYNCKVELADFSTRPNANILDAGCGSGVVTRYLSQLYPEGQVTGCDLSEDRVQRAQESAKGIRNINFKAENLSQLSFSSSHFDAIICRSVLQHLDASTLQKTLHEFHRCLRPGGKVVAIDMDGFIYNLFPQTELVKKVFHEAQSHLPLDLYIGRKLPHLMTQVGFENITWRIDTHSFQGETLKAELSLIRERFDNAFPFLKNLLGSESAVKQFMQEYFDCALSPGAVLFFNKFVVTGEKQKLKKV